MWLLLFLLSSVPVFSGQDCVDCGAKQSGLPEVALPKIPEVPILDCLMGAQALPLFGKSNVFLGYLPNSGGTVLMYRPEGLYVYSDREARFYPIGKVPTKGDGSSRNLELQFPGLKPYYLFVNASPAPGSFWAATRIVEEEKPAGIPFHKLVEKPMTGAALQSVLRNALLEMLSFEKPSGPADVVKFGGTRLVFYDRMGRKVEKKQSEFWKEQLELCASVGEPAIRDVAEAKLELLFPEQGSVP